jgi:hypothetical protein
MLPLKGLSRLFKHGSPMSTSSTNVILKPPVE